MGKGCQFQLIYFYFQRNERLDKFVEDMKRGLGGKKMW